MPRRGMTLIEVMLGFVIIVTMSLGVLSIMPAIFATETRAEKRAFSSVAANYVLGAFRARSFSQISSASDTVFGTSADQIQQYTYNLAVASLGTNLKRLTLTLSWSDNGRSTSLVVETQVFGGGGTGGQQ